MRYKRSWHSELGSMLDIKEEAVTEVDFRASSCCQRKLLDIEYLSNRVGKCCHCCCPPVDNHLPTQVLIVNRQTYGYHHKDVQPFKEKGGAK